MRSGPPYLQYIFNRNKKRLLKDKYRHTERRVGKSRFHSTVLCIDWQYDIRVLLSHLLSAENKNKNSPGPTVVSGCQVLPHVICQAEKMSVFIMKQYLHP